MAAKKILDAVTSTGADGLVNGFSLAQAVQINLEYSGAPSAVVLDVEGSLDGGVTWTQLAQKTMSAGEITAKVASFTIVDQPRNLIRHNLTTLTGGTGVTVTTRHDSLNPNSPGV